MWILVADSSQARIFVSAGRKQSLQLIKEFFHPKGRAHSRDLLTDKPGRSFDSVGLGRHATSSEIDPHKEEAIKFAEKIADYLITEHGKNSFYNLAIIAPPQFLGILREKLHGIVKTITQEVPKNLASWMREPELIEHVRRDLNL